VLDLLDQRYPLLGKELLELANRRRTYTTRVIVSGLFFVGFMVLLWAETHGAGLAVLGSGGEVFPMIICIQFMAIYLFLPAMFFDAIARERETGSLDLLLIAMPSYAVVNQKYFGRLLPAFNFLLLSLPIYAICFLYGGLQVQELIQGMFYLVLTCFQVGAYALMISALCRTSMQALIVAYVGYALAVIWIILSYSLVPDYAEEMTLPLSFYNQWSVEKFYWSSIPMIGAFLLLADRAVAYPDLLQGFIPRKFRKAKQQPVRPLPDDQPMRWMEQVRTIRFSPRRTKLLVGLTIASLGVPFMIYRAGGYNAKGDLFFLLLVAWGSVALRVGARSLHAVTRERDSGTLGVLMTAPIDGRHFMQEKAWMIHWYRNLMLLVVGCWLVIKITYLVDGWRSPIPLSINLNTRFQMLIYLQAALSYIKYAILTLLPVLIFVPLCGWTSFYIALRIRHRIWAVLTMLGVLVVWTLAPLACLAVFTEVMQVHHPVLLLVGLPSPLFTLLLTEYPAGMDVRFGPLYRFAPLVSLTGFFLIQLFVRSRVLKRADVLLRG
jgi:ABC-type transport system involved in multi-copper enzyme maturation permease subunit